MEQAQSSTGGQPVPRWYLAAVPALITGLGVVVVVAALTA